MAGETLFCAHEYYTNEHQKPAGGKAHNHARHAAFSLRTQDNNNGHCDCQQHSKSKQDITKSGPSGPRFILCSGLLRPLTLAAKGKATVIAEGRLRVDHGTATRAVAWCWQATAGAERLPHEERGSTPGTPEHLWLHTNPPYLALLIIHRLDTDWNTPFPSSHSTQCHCELVIGSRI